MTDKVIRDGKVAVLYSPGYGAGWSTWNDLSVTKTLVFHPKLVELVESDQRHKITEQLIEELIGYDVINDVDNPVNICDLGSQDLEIKWIDIGTRFEIREYDGSENIYFPDLELRTLTA